MELLKMSRVLKRAAKEKQLQLDDIEVKKRCIEDKTEIIRKSWPVFVVAIQKYILLWNAKLAFITWSEENK